MRAVYTLYRFNGEVFSQYVSVDNWPNVLILLSTEIFPAATTEFNCSYVKDRQ